ncbi:hydrolase [Cohnella terricola]|uniref:Hydrolase n=1 Tax=Cohnella terricola TaxID=1289167 RepID=A0A559JTR1_9BACL|nr:hydrolase [Cohnella terricola]TVY03268.1 hydrolase [Cohnella terricola]
MIFACDLDRTLIYSRNSMGATESDELVPVEKYEGEDLSYMTRSAHRLLQRLSRELHFVPTTTRVHEQYARIHGFSDGIHCRYAIVSNGGKVLVDGRADMQWDRLLRQTVRKESASSAEIRSFFDRLVKEEWVMKERLCDELFYAFVVKRELLPSGFMEELAREIGGHGWNCSLQGRKIYLVPNPVSKGAAVEYVKQLSGSRYVFAAGDSLLDESMLLIADEALAPGHGELFRKYGGKHERIRFTRSEGIRASEDILATLTNRMEAGTA